MPIRTDRGRNAALRQLATWPLYSPKRLFALAGLAAAIATSITILAAATSPKPPPPTATPPTSLTTVPSPNTTSTSSNVAGDPRTVTRRFADAWVTRTDVTTWRARLNPLCTDEYRATALPTTAPDLVTATKVTGTPVIRQAKGRSAEITIPLDTMTLALRLQDITGSGDWRISDAQPAR